MVIFLSNKFPLLYFLKISIQAQLVVHDLEEKLESLEALDLEGKLEGGKEIRVWMDG